MVFMQSDEHVHIPNFTWFEPLQYKRVEEMAVVRAPSQAVIVAHTYVRRRFPFFRPRFDVFSRKRVQLTMHIRLCSALEPTPWFPFAFILLPPKWQNMIQKCYSFRCLCVPARYQLRVGDTTLPNAAWIVYPPCPYLYDRRCDWIICMDLRVCAT